MKIMKLEAENVKRLKAVRIEPSGEELVVIGGRNAQGKTSVLDAITMALGGKDSMPAQPVRKGQASAHVLVDLGDLVVERKIKDGSTTLVVRNKDGATQRTPQTILDGLVGKLTFDPLQFFRMEPGAQAAVLREIVGLDLSALEQGRAELYAMRTETNRQAKMLAANLGNHGLALEEEPKKINTEQLTSYLKEVQEAARKIEDRNNERRNMKRQIEELRAKLQELEPIYQIAGREEEVPRLEPHIEQIAKAQETNVAADAIKARNNLRHNLKLEQEAADHITQQLEDLDKAKAAKLAAVKMPIKGLGVGDDGVTLNGLPLDQASSAEQLRVSVAIGLAANPKLRVLLIRDGSLLDAANLELVRKMAEDADAQVWLERVGEGKESSVVIEDGEVRS
jgi:recombinational DNA repair ATPase RecF